MTQIQPRHAVFRSIRAQVIDWKSCPASPRSVRLIVLVGDSAKKATKLSLSPPSARELIRPSLPAQRAGWRTGNFHHVLTPERATHAADRVRKFPSCDIVVHAPWRSVPRDC